MDKTDPSESNYETGNGDNLRTESDNKLTPDMLTNKELSHRLVAIRAENAALRDKNEKLNLENQTYRNELIENRSEIMKWKKKFTDLKAIHIQHCQTVTAELQSCAKKLRCVFGEDTTEWISKSSKLAKPITRQPDVLDGNTSALSTINEECEEDVEASDSEQISLVTSSHESTSADTTIISESVYESEATKSLITETSLSAASEVTSMDCDKENEGRSSFFSAELNIPNGSSPISIENNLSTTRTSKTIVQTPLKEKFIAQYHTQTQKRTFEVPKIPELVFSTPRKRSATDSEESARAKANHSSSVRPKRSVCPVNLVERKLNTKLRRT